MSSHPTLSFDTEDESIVLLRLRRLEKEENDGSTDPKAFFEYFLTQDSSTHPQLNEVLVISQRNANKESEAYLGNISITVDVVRSVSIGNSRKGVIQASIENDTDASKYFSVR